MFLLYGFSDIADYKKKLKRRWVADYIRAGFCAEALAISQWQVESRGKLLCDVKHFSLDSNADGSREEKTMETEEKVWEILLSADKKDYERICAEYGITDFRGMLKKLSEMKKEREEEIAAVWNLLVEFYYLSLNIELF